MTGWPLDGTTVLDLSHFEAGPTCTQVLAFLGARVIKLEPPITGEAGRSRVPGTHAGGSAMWAAFNTGKESMTADLRTALGQEVAHRLAAVVDVVVTNFRPGVSDRLGVGYEQLRTVNPRLVYVSVTGYPADSPWAQHAAFDPIVQTMGGIAAATGEPDGNPVRAGVNVVDSTSGLHAAIGTLAALLERGTTGRGAFVEVSMLDAALNLCRPLFGSAFDPGRRVGRTGNGPAVPGPVPAGLFPCRPFGADDFVAVFVAPHENAWQDFVAAIDEAALATDPALATPADRWAARERIDDRLRNWLRAHDKDSAARALAEAGVPAAPLRNVADLLADEYLSTVGSLKGGFSWGGTIVRAPACAVTINGRRRDLGAPPELGEHTAAVLSGLLGLTTEQAADLQAQASG